MKKNTEYGFITVNKDERQIMENLQSFLAQNHNKRIFSKSKSKGILEALLPYKYKYVYFNLNKEKSTMMHLLPNEDSEGNFKYPERKDIAWILQVRIVGDYYHDIDGYDKTRTEKYINDILDAVGLKKVILNEHD